MNKVASMPYRSPARAHDRDHFFKYASFNTALRVIENKSFRWSSPVNFNDPFDNQTGFVLDIDQPTFARLLAESMERMIFTDAMQHDSASRMFTALLARSREIRDRLPRQQMMASLYEGCKESAALLEGGILDLNMQMNMVLCHSRVFCVSEIHNNVVMWSHYADQHRGVVFKLRCIDELDNVLLAARKVQYTDKFVAFPSAEEYAKHLTGEQPLDMVPLCWNLAFAKHIDWAYEREWRVHMPLLRQPPGDGYSIFPEKPAVFEAIYLGCRMGEPEIHAITEAAQRSLPGMKIFHAEKGRTDFTLAFREL